MPSVFLEQEDSLQNLVDQMGGRDREVYRGFRHLRVEPTFNDRILVVFSPSGLNERNEHRPPMVHTTVRVLNLFVNSLEGTVIRVQDDATGQTQDITYIPKRLFHYDVFVSVPPEMNLHWRARLDEAGAIRRSMSWLMLIKTRNRADWYSAGVMQAETPNNFKKLFPKSNLMFN